VVMVLQRLRLRGHRPVYTIFPPTITCCLRSVPTMLLLPHLPCHRRALLTLYLGVVQTPWMCSALLARLILGLILGIAGWLLTLITCNRVQSLLAARFIDFVSRLTPLLKKLRRPRMLGIRLFKIFLIMCIIPSSACDILPVTLLRLTVFMHITHASRLCTPAAKCA